MDRRAASFFAAGLLAGLLVATAGFAWIHRQTPQTGSRQATPTLALKLAHVLEPAHPVHRAMEHLRQRLEALSSGTMTLTIYPSGILGSETECLEQVQQGTLALTKTSAAALDSFVPELAVFSLPYVFRDQDHLWAVLESPLGRELLLKGGARQLRGLCYYDAGSRSFYTVSRPVLTPADLRGMKVRVMNSRTAMDTISALGGAPTPIAFGELYTALQQGTVDGAENNPPSLLTSRHYEVCKHYSLDEHARIPDILLINARWWDNLTPAQQGWLQQAANESSALQRRLWTEATAADLKTLESKGVKIYRPDPKPFAEAVRPLLDRQRGTPAGTWLERIERQP